MGKVVYLLHLERISCWYNDWQTQQQKQIPFGMTTRSEGLCTPIYG